MADENKNVVEFDLGVPTHDNLKKFYKVMDETIVAQDWLPCNKVGCCDGEAGCCRHALTVSVTWLEMEAVYLEIEKFDPELRRSIAADAKRQLDAVEKLQPEFFEHIKESESMSLEMIKKLETSLGELEDRCCPLLDKETNICRVRESRFLTCRAFGQTVTTDDKSDPIFQGCDKSFEEVLKHPEATFPNYRAIKNNFMIIATAKYQMPHIIKPVQAWILDLTDETGDITNPNNLFVNIRAYMQEYYDHRQARKENMGLINDQKE